MSSDEPGPDPLSPAPVSRWRASVEWVLIVAVAGLVVLGCSKANDAATAPDATTTSSQIQGALGETVNRVTSELDDKQKKCIQDDKGGPAEAASNCVDRADLAKQVVNQIKAMGITDDAFLQCVTKAIEGLSNDDLQKLAGGTDSKTMGTFYDDIANCLGTSTRSAPRKFSSVASAIS